MSSSYNSSFTKNENEKDLQYDDSAFWFFSLATLTCLAIPIAKSLISTIRSFRHFRAKHDQMCSCSICLAKRPKILASRKLPFTFYRKLFFFLLLLFGIYKVGSLALEASNFKSFDPYELLEIEFGASDKEIKAAYRKMARKHHPDLNPGDALAANRFIQINKAYECLIDPKFKENCAKFGNPEGHSSFQVGIALPTFLLEKENSQLILSIFFLMLLLFVIIYMISLQGTDMKDQFGIDKDFQAIIYSYIKNDNLQFSGLIEMCLFLKENKKLAIVKMEQRKFMKKIDCGDVKFSKGKKFKEAYLKTMGLFYHFMSEDEPVPQCFADDLEKLQINTLAACASFYQSVIEIVHHKRQYCRIFFSKKFIYYFDAENLIILILV